MSRLPGIAHCLHCISRCSLAPSSWMPLIWCAVGEHTRARDGGVCNADGRLHFMRQQEEIGSTRYTSSAHEMPTKLNERNVNDACRSFSCSDMNTELGSVKNCDEEAVTNASEDFLTFSDELPKAQGREELENELSRRIESIIKRCESSDTERTTLGRLSGVEFDEQPKVDVDFDFNADFDKLEFHENGNSILLTEKNEENNFTDNSQQLGKITDSEINTASLDNRVTIQEENPLVDTNDDSATPSAKLTKCSTEFSEASRRIGELHAAMLKVMNHSESLKHLSNEFKALALSKNEDTKRLDSSSSTIQRNDIKEDFIPAYKPFQTIEVPVQGAESDEEPHVSKPAADVSSESKASRDTKESQESSASIVNKSGRTVIDTNMNDPQSKQIMRYALLRALQRLEDGTGYFSAKIIITDP